VAGSAWSWFLVILLRYHANSGVCPPVWRRESRVLCEGVKSFSCSLFKYVVWGTAEMISVPPYELFESKRTLRYVSFTSHHTLDSVMVQCWTYSWTLKGLTQLVTTLMSDCLQTDESSSYITNTKANSAFHPFGVDKSSTSVSG